MDNCDNMGNHISINFLFLLHYIIFLLITSCTRTYSDSNFEYNISSPKSILTLQEELHEISGITCFFGNIIACVQDENGVIFFLDIDKNAIIKQVPFNGDGDYEGIAKAGDVLYVLRSNGTLFEISNLESDEITRKVIQTGIPAKDNEGLCYDADSNRLLIGCKSNIQKGSAFRDKRAIYAFHLSNKRLSDSPVYLFNINDIKKYAYNNGIALPKKEKKDKGFRNIILKFRISSICKHPVTKKLYLLSAMDHLLFIFDENGKIEHIEQLDHERFNKSEGMTFCDNGDMIISNEGGEKKPTLIRIKRIF